MLIEMCSNETLSKVWVCKQLPGVFPVQNGLE